MKKMIGLLLLGCLVSGLASPAAATTADGRRKLIIIAGKPSHWPRTHEFRAGALLLQRCLTNVPGLTVEVADSGWVTDQKTFDNADAVVFYADGYSNSPAIQGDHLAKLGELVKRGVGLGCIHSVVEVPPGNGSDEFKKWLGGFYQINYSCNPEWAPNFASLPNHPITRGVKPFQIRDEWYFNIRFADGFSADKVSTANNMTYWPILAAVPSDAVRKGSYSYPKGPYDHIIAASGRSEVLMWAVERPDGGRGFGFTGGHYQANWGDENFRKTVLNALVWLARLEVPSNGVQSQLTKVDLDKNLDHKVVKDNKLIIGP